MVEALVILVIACLVMLVLILVALLRGAGRRGEVGLRLETLEKGQERAERTVREELARSRQESGERAKQLRDEVGVSLKGVGDSVVGAVGTLREATDKRLDVMRGVVDERLRLLQEDNTRKLDQMRQVVDERLQGTLEKRLGESFKQVSERLEQVHRGLGEMRQLANGVGDLKRVLSNVKTRGTWGEIQLGALLEQLLAPQQYETNFAAKERSPERVEYAIRLPGPDDEDETCDVWLPVDAKFPMERYQAVLEAQERAEPELIERAVKELEAAVKSSARAIRNKYINPPRTTDFAIMYLPGEGLYAEILRRPGLAEWVQYECRVTITGPTTITALLNALQVGFRTLAIQKRAGEVWKVLGAVKTEFGRFGGILDGVQKKLQEASNKVEAAARRTRVIERKLRDVEELPEADAGAAARPDGDTLAIEPKLDVPSTTEGPTG